MGGNVSVPNAVGRLKSLGKGADGDHPVRATMLTLPRPSSISGPATLPFLSGPEYVLEVSSRTPGPTRGLCSSLMMVVPTVPTFDEDTYRPRGGPSQFL